MKRLSIAGLGYIGLPIAIHAAQRGYDVIGYDIDEKRIEDINAGISPIQEEGVQKNLRAVLRAKTFYSYTKITLADYFLIAVPTPFDKNKDPDLSYVFTAVESIATVLEPENIVILESTVPIGTTRKICDILEKKTNMRAGIDFYVAHCPERIIPGNMFNELLHNDRVIGGINKESSEKAIQFYEPLVQSSMFVTDDKTAEMVKLVENTSRDVSIAFANEIAAIAVKNSINPHELIMLANKHPRVNILNPGIGVGGHCIAVDPWFLISNHPNESGLLKQARLVNEMQPQRVFNRIVSSVEELKKRDQYKDRKIKVGILGLTYKSDVDDLRESPALQIAQLLKHNKNIEMIICEPNVSEEKINKLGFKQNMGLWQTVSSADFVVILVAHKEFFSLRLTDIDNKLFFDPCGLFFKISMLDNNLNNQSVHMHQASSLFHKPL
ncbi:nucleotide sugar dehydrogenase [Candidatus Babeliales bacterium]|nr:nucleotide sugar dehydrogenase [Candidatus Babeliales bacterium]